MNIHINTFTTPAADPAQVVLLNDASQMSEPSVEVLSCKEISNPRLKLSGRDGYVYTVALTDKDEQKTVREIYMTCSEGHAPNYDYLHFIAPEAEGDKFYKAHRSKRWTKEEISPDIKKAIYLFDNPEDAKKKHEMNGDEAHAHLRVVGRPRTEYKPN